jgi:uncharacterized protein
MIDKAEKIVKKACRTPKKGKKQIWDWNFWRYHVSLVVKNAQLLAKKLGANGEVVELAALLHDIGAIKFGKENHENTGALEAEKILKKLNYPQQTINEVKYCIKAHRGSSKKKPRSLEAEIIRNADAMAHFDTVPSLFRAALILKKNNLKQAQQWFLEKIERDWNQKLTISEARKMMEKKYKAISSLFTFRE